MFGNLLRFSKQLGVPRGNWLNTGFPATRSPRFKCFLIAIGILLFHASASAQCQKTLVEITQEAQGAQSLRLRVQTIYIKGWDCWSEDSESTNVKLEYLRNYGQDALEIAKQYQGDQRWAPEYAQIALERLTEYLNLFATLPQPNHLRYCEVQTMQNEAQRLLTNVSTHHPARKTSPLSDRSSCEDRAVLAAYGLFTTKTAQPNSRSATQTLNRYGPKN